ncbi:MAG: aminopeptidase [Thermoplasmata archaeon]|nr:MAG: aminopeptidase [Thermoplasmata archaeon]
MVITLMDGARIAINNCLAVKKREMVLIITDTERMNIAQALFEAAEETGADPVLMSMPPRSRHGEEPPEIIAQAMRRADVILAPTTFSLTHTQARKVATRLGARIATMPGITTEMMSKGGMTANFRQIARQISRLHRRIKNAKEAHITTEMGTDLYMSLKGRKWVTEDNGLCYKKGSYTNLPAGEIFIPPVEGTTYGNLFIDAAFVDKVEKPVRVTIVDGFAVDIINAVEVRNQLMEVGHNAFNIAELGIGMNPKSKLIGNILEDEKILGTVHIGFGDNSTFGGKVQCGIYISGVVTKPTLTIDNKVIIENGELK